MVFAFFSPGPLEIIIVGTLLMIWLVFRLVRFVLRVTSREPNPNLTPMPRPRPLRLPNRAQLSAVRPTANAGRMTD